MTQASKLLPSSRADGSVFSAADLGSEVKGQRDTKPCVADDSATSGTAKHTPGPWRVASGDNRRPLPTESDQEICCLPHIAFDAVEIFPPKHGHGAHNCKWDEFIANARLIAAAPEMREVCGAFSVTTQDGLVTLRVKGKVVVSWSEDEPEAKALIALGLLRCAAIAKATGAA